LPSLANSPSFQEGGDRGPSPKRERKRGKGGALFEVLPQRGEERGEANADNIRF